MAARFHLTHNGDGSVTLRGAQVDEEGRRLGGESNILRVYANGRVHRFPFINSRLGLAMDAEGRIAVLN